MAQWEQRYFLQLAKQWRKEDSKADLPKDFLAAKRERAPERAVEREMLRRGAVATACGATSRTRWTTSPLAHSLKAAFCEVRDHWLADTLRVARQEEQELRQQEAALGLPGALAPAHAAELRRQRDLLPGKLRTVLEQRLSERCLRALGLLKHDLLAYHVYCIALSIIYIYILHIIYNIVYYITYTHMT